MDRPSPAQFNLARRILDHEQGSPPHGSVGESAARASKKLQQRLGRVFSDMGTQALLRRAVYLASTDFPPLAPANGADNDEVLSDALDHLGPTEAHGAANAVFANIIALLARFIGDDLALRALGEVWPEPVPVQPDDAGHEVRK